MVTELSRASDEPPRVRPLNHAEELVWSSLLRLAGGLPRAVAHDVQRGSGTTWSQYSILLQLSLVADQRLCMTDLAQRVHLSPSRLSRVVDELAMGGLVVRQRLSKDKRNVAALLTVAGMSTLDLARPYHLESVRLHAFNHLSTDEVATLSAILERLVEFLDDSFPTVGTPAAELGPSTEASD